MSRLSDILIKSREHKKLTQKQVAKLIGKGLRTYQYYEVGRVTPKGSTLEKLSKTLNFSLSDIYADGAIQLHNEELILLDDKDEIINDFKEKYYEALEEIRVLQRQLLDKQKNALPPLKKEKAVK